MQKKTIKSYGSTDIKDLVTLMCVLLCNFYLHVYNDLKLNN